MSFRITTTSIFGQLHLNSNFDTTLAARRTLAQAGQQVRDVVPRMSVETGLQSLLVEVVRNQTDGAAEHEQTVQDTVLEVVLRLFAAEGAAVAHEIDEADGHAAVDVEDQVVLLGRRHRLDCDGVVEKAVRREVLENELLDELDTEIRVGAGFDLVADTRDYVC